MANTEWVAKVEEIVEDNERILHTKLVRRETLREGDVFTKLVGDQNDNSFYYLYKSGQETPLPMEEVAAIFGGKRLIEE